MNKIIYTALKEKLSEKGFKEKEIVIKAQSFQFVKALVLKTLNINRAVVVIDISDSDFIIDKNSLTLLRKEIRKSLGYIFFFYPLGIQLVFITDRVIDLNLYNLVAKYDNQRAIVQSIFIFEKENLYFLMARSPSQYVTGKYQSIIESVLRRFTRDCDYGSNMY